MKDVSTFYQKIVYAGVDENALLNCTLRSHPMLNTHDIEVVHLHSNVKIEQFEITSANNNDETIIKLTFDRVTLDDFGIYQVSASNGVGEELKIEMDLRKQGTYYIYAFHKLIQLVIVGFLNNYGVNNKVKRP